MEITKELLNEIFEYKNGELFWKKCLSNRSPIGSKAGTHHNRGYVQTRLFKTHWLNHRLVYIMHNGAIDGFIDHIDGNKTNNKIENLRLANNSQNLLNGKKPKNNKSGVKGVCFDKANNKWLAYGRLDGKTKFLGRFIDKSEAEKIVRQFRIDNHGQFMNHGD